MDRTSWKPKIYKATETVDYKAEEEGTSDGAKKGWLTRQRGGGSAEEPKKDFVPIDWSGQVGATKSEADQSMADNVMIKFNELEEQFGNDKDKIIEAIRVVTKNRYKDGFETEANNKTMNKSMASIGG